MNELNEFELFAVLLLFPVLCYPLTFWMKGWMCMGRLVVCCASWAPQWWWYMPRKKRRLPLLPPWQRSSKTQVQREVDQWAFTGVIWLTLLWKLNPYITGWMDLFQATNSLLNTPTRFHCVCCVRCGKQPGSYLCCGSAVRTEECAGLHPDLLCDWLPLCVLCQGPGHWH